MIKGLEKLNWDLPGIKKLYLYRRIVVYLTLAAVLGVWVGTMLHKNTTPAYAAYEDGVQVLLIGVNRLAPKGKIESLWVVSIPESSDEIEMTPLYPIPEGRDDLGIGKLLRQFKLGKDRAPSGEFLSSIRAQVYFDRYVVFDSGLLSRVLKTIPAMVYQGNEFAPAETALSIMPVAQKDPIGAFEFQSFLAMGICNSVVEGTQVVPLFSAYMDAQEDYLGGNLTLDYLYHAYYQYVYWKDRSCTLNSLSN